MTDTGTNTDRPAPGRVRASDVEREEYAKVIRTAMTEGRLNLEEGEERLGRVYAATYRDDLGPLIADLPSSTMFNTPEFVDEAKYRLRAHTGRVVSVAALLTGIWLLVAILVHPVFFWPIIPIAIMSIGLMRHRRWYRWQQRGWSPWANRGWAQGQGHQGPPWAHRGGRGGWHGASGWHAQAGAQAGPGWQPGSCGRGH
ncbi:DUF1707 SHOCT-like domain-containing protein [Virgisporangium aurantiacum]|uniref:DUF1707 domain-containing protein n=1 Tax=Virgisporangium aurantiacum TaxID=175570 RepID=A0A8J3ZAY8_9ACTN|nr:DUF1707 domain-containing protein [Virgisporangium aurantiacum]GIJ60629.1 hypothetical protein Vau01_081450 [Virgisporangium aurantiacum]